MTPRGWLLTERGYLFAVTDIGITAEGVQFTASAEVPPGPPWTFPAGQIGVAILTPMRDLAGGVYVTLGPRTVDPGQVMHIILPIRVMPAAGSESGWAEMACRAREIASC